MYGHMVISCRMCHTMSSAVFYKELKSKWWDTSSVLGPLHAMNSLRVPLIRDGIINSLSKEPKVPSQFLKGFRILDIGCGGGILCEPLARLGANVTGVDPVAESIEVARAHADLDESVRPNVNYICGLAEDIPTEPGFDGVIASEVMEHVKDPNSFIEKAVALTKTNGSLFFTTLNRTWLSYALGIVAAEYILGIVPKGTHDWNMFISPRDLQFLLEAKGCEIRLVHGMCYNPLTKRFSWQKDTSVNYAIHAIKRS